VPDTESKTSSVRIVLKDMRSVLRVTRRVTANSSRSRSRSRSRSTTGRIRKTAVQRLAFQRLRKRVFSPRLATCGSRIRCCFCC